MKLKLVIFSGGRGTTSIVEALLRHDQTLVTSIVNAYDDGLSTGRIRGFVEGMLGSPQTAWANSRNNRESRSIGGSNSSKKKRIRLVVSRCTSKPPSTSITIRSNAF